MEDKTVKNSMEEIEVPEKWEDVFCPDYFLDQLEFFPDPEQIIYVQSFAGEQPIFALGFRKKENTDYWLPMRIKDFISLSWKMGWRVGLSWGFMD